MSNPTIDLPLIARNAKGEGALGALRCSPGDPVFIFLAYHEESLLGLPRFADAYIMRQAMVKWGGGHVGHIA
jgi:hypothetical protein